MKDEFNLSSHHGKCREIYQDSAGHACTQQDANLLIYMVRKTGLEPAHLAALEPKSIL